MKRVIVAVVALAFLGAFVAPVVAGDVPENYNLKTPEGITQFYTDNSENSN